MDNKKIIDNVLKQIKELNNNLFYESNEEEDYISKQLLVLSTQLHNALIYKQSITKNK